MHRKSLITICIPMYNESDNIEGFYYALTTVINDLDNYDFEILFINDGSLDDSLNKVRSLGQSDARIKFIDLSRNYGKEIAMAAGFDYANGRAVITMDADLQHPPSIILDMIKYWEEGFQDVYGKRIDRIGESFLKQKSSQLFYWALSKFSQLPVLPSVGDYRLLDRQCIEGIKKLREAQRYTKGLYMWIGYKKKEVPFIAQERHAGQSKWKGFDLIGLAINGIISSSTMPLRLSSLLGIIISLSSFIYMLYLLCITIIFGTDVPGYPSIVILLLFLGGVQLLTIGILGEYIGKIYIESKQRPLYLVQEHSDGAVSLNVKK